MEIFQTISEIMKAIDNSSIAGGILISLLSTGFTASIVGAISRHKRLKNSVTKEQLKNSIQEAKDYTDDRLVEHNKLQSLELRNFELQLSETHNMVKFIYQKAYEKSITEKGGG